MYKLYIADDEPHVLDGLSKCIPWEQHGIVIIGMATDGAAAYNDILRLLPDIVITDIKMPLLDGITLINQVHSQLPNINFIIFSGYNDFHYAREAILANAVDFLVKPSSTEELLHAVTLAITAKSKKEEVKCIDYNSSNYRNLLKSIFMNPTSDIYSEGHYYVIIIDTLEVSTISIQNKEEDIFIDSQMFHCSFINLLDSHLIVLYAKSVITSNDWNYLASMILGKINVYFTVSNDFISLGISNPNKLHNLKKGYQEAQLAIEFCKWFSVSNCLYNQIQYTDISIDSLSFWNKLTVGISKRELPYIISILETEFTEFMKIHISPTSLKEFCLKAHLLVNNEISNSYTINPILEISNLSSVSDSQIYLINLYRHYFEMEGTSLSSRQSKTIQKAMLFVQQHYQEPLSLHDVSDYTNKSIGYLSNKFKKEVGISFSQYVTDFRLLKARELLISSNLKIKQIALAVGFSDEQYFSLVFKKECGLTAGIYRKMYQKD